MRVIEQKEQDPERVGQLPVMSKRRRSKKAYVVLALVTLLVLLGGSLEGIWAAQQSYQVDLALAHTGTQHLQNALHLLVTLQQNPFAATTVGQARNEFTGALQSLTQLNTELKAIPAVGQQVPVYGERLGTALQLVPLAMTLAQAGIIGCDLLQLLIDRLHAPLSSPETGLNSSDLGTIAHDTKQLESLFLSAQVYARQVRPANVQFDPRIGALLANFQQNAPMIQGWFDTIGQLLPALPHLLGINTPSHYLVELLDSTELRPGGGFIGNYGIATLTGGKLESVSIANVEFLDLPGGQPVAHIPYPPEYQWFHLAPYWSLRDSNLDADFPTAARYAEQNYRREGGTTEFQGVIAMTPALIQQILAITGPIAVPEYHDLVNEHNLIERIHYHQLGHYVGAGDPRQSATERKRFTALLAEHLLTRLRQLTPTTSAKILPVLITALRTKDIQIYLNADAAEQLLHRSAIDASLRLPVGDGLFVVDANIGGSKANALISSRLSDEVTLDGQGNAFHHTTLSYIWQTQGPTYGNELYRDYLRVYVPPGSTLQRQSGWEPAGTSEGFHQTVWAGIFTLASGETRTITFDWTAPPLAQLTAGSWHYEYLLQRQAGILRQVSFQFFMPACSVAGTQLYKSKPVQRQFVLTENVVTELTYNCASSHSG